MSNSEFINLFFKSIAGLAYVVVGFYLEFTEGIDLGVLMGIQTQYLMGTLFIIYGLFRIYRAYKFYKEINEEKYGSYEDEN